VTLPRRIKKQSVRQSDRVRCPAHLKFIRQHHCVIGGCNEVPTIAHHVRMGLAGGTSLLPPDDRAIALCNSHHTTGPDAIHRLGEKQFEWRFGIDLIAKAEEFASRSDALRRYLARKRAA
jgi:hypothetical protein